MPGERRSPMDAINDEFRATTTRVAAYYSATLARHGATPAGVDWESAAFQQIRFAALLKIVDVTRPFSLNDLGCGYGALLGYLRDRVTVPDVDYLGVDVSEEMIRAALHVWGTTPGAAFAVGAECPRRAVYSVASGIFNVRTGLRPAIWDRYVTRVLGGLYRASRVGFAVNFRAHSMPGLSSPGLYETEPEPWARFCEEDFGSSVEVVADYGLREFTLLVRRKA